MYKQTCSYIDVTWLHLKIDSVQLRVCRAHFLGSSPMNYDDLWFGALSLIVLKLKEKKVMYKLISSLFIENDIHKLMEKPQVISWSQSQKLTK